MTKSLYCAIANLDATLTLAVTTQPRPYTLSATCEYMARFHFTSNHFNPVVYPPATYCDQAPIPGEIPYL